jgi:hypothetical protein
VGRSVNNCGKGSLERRRTNLAESLSFDTGRFVCCPICLLSSSIDDKQQQIGARRSRLLKSKRVSRSFIGSGGCAFPLVGPSKLKESLKTNQRHPRQGREPITGGQHHRGTAHAEGYSKFPRPSWHSRHSTSKTDNTNSAA